HQVCQYSAGVIMLGGLGLILARPERAFELNSHSLFGWAVILLAAVQITGGLLRGSKGGPSEEKAGRGLKGDHYDMTRRRLIFEYVHKSVGYVALVLSAIAILLGLWEANGPVWMWLMLLGWWGVLIVAFALLQRRGMAIDTYEAIWGPSPQHPGNHRRPIGFGIRRMDGHPGE
ncbi:MAG: cytochrome b561 domain-containing protein, partial [Pseudomonadota bacterium]